MTRRAHFNSRIGFLLLTPIFAATPTCTVAQPAPAALAAFSSYTNSVESRLATQHRSPNAFLVPVATTPQNDARLRQGELIVEQLTPQSGTDLPGSLLHHWRGTAFAAGAHATDFELLLRDFAAYPQLFSPEVLRAKVLTQTSDAYADRLQATMRVRQRHVIAVVMDTDYDVTFGRLDARHGYSLSRSTRIAEIDSPGTAAERALTPAEEHGFLWRQNTYWSYEERDGGLYLQVESVSLTRSIPRGLGWAVAPYVESIPRDSLEFTLRAVCDALRSSQSQTSRR
jgi:hypothetical protein